MTSRVFRQKALKVGAIKAIIMDARDVFVKSFVFPALAG